MADVFYACVHSYSSVPQDIFDMIVAQEPIHMRCIKNGLERLGYQDFLYTENIKIVVEAGGYALVVSDLLVFLHCKELLNDINLVKVRRQQYHIINILASLKSMSRAQLLNQYDFDKIMRAGAKNYNKYTHSWLYALEQENMLTQDNFNKGINKTYFDGLHGHALHHLRRDNIMTVDNFTSLLAVKHRDLLKFSVALRNLCDNGLLSQDNFNALRNMKNLGAVSSAVSRLASCEPTLDILTQNNFDSLVNAGDAAKHISFGIAILSKSKLSINQEQFNLLIECANDNKDKLISLVNGLSQLPVESEGVMRGNPIDVYK